MTLRCECGGSVEITDAPEPDDTGPAVFESYECVSCGRSGSYYFNRDTGEDSLSGCLTRGMAGVNRGP